MNNAIPFSALRPGDVFRAVGFKGAENMAFRKADARRAFRVQDGTWQAFPLEWPVRLEDSVLNPDPGAALALELREARRPATVEEHDAFPNGRWITNQQTNTERKTQ